MQSAEQCRSGPSLTGTICYPVFAKSILSSIAVTLRSTVTSYTERMAEVYRRGLRCKSARQNSLGLDGKESDRAGKVHALIMKRLSGRRRLLN